MLCTTAALRRAITEMGTSAPKICRPKNHSRSSQKHAQESLRHAPKQLLAGYCQESRSLCNARPTFEPIITRRKSRRPIFQPKRQKATPTSMKQAMLSTPCTICPPSVLKNAPLLGSTNPVIAPTIMVAPSKLKSITRTRYSRITYHYLVVPYKGSKPCAQNGKFSLIVSK
jgi:hypothetical protein